MQSQYLGVSETFNFQEVETKGDKEFYISGYISTKSLDKFNDLISDECLDDMIVQIKSGSIKIDYEHETIHEGNLDKNPIARIVDAKRDHKGVWVKALLNQANTKFKEIWGSIKDGFLDSFSIAFKPLESSTRYIQGKAVRLLNKLKLINVGITGTPVNDECKLDKVVVKAIKDLIEEPITEEEFYEEIPIEETQDLELDMDKKALTSQAGGLAGTSHSSSEETKAKMEENQPIEPIEENQEVQEEVSEKQPEKEEVKEDVARDS